MITKELKQLYDKAFNVHNANSNYLVQRIVEDREYNIPDWFYSYIDEQTLLSIINNAEWIESQDEFLLNCIKFKVIKNYSLFCNGLIDNKLIQYGYFIEPKIMFKYLFNNIDNVSIEDIIKLILYCSKFIYRTTDEFGVPVYYVKLYTIKYVMVHGCGLGEAFDKLLENIWECADVYIVDAIFETIYNNFGTVYNEYHEGSCCAWYWKTLNGNAIPYNLSIYDIKKYFEIISSRENVYINKNFVPRCITALQGASRINNIIQKYIKYAIEKDINNVSAVYWDLDITEIEWLIGKFKSNPEKLYDYYYLYRVTDYIPNQDEIIKYLANGGKYSSIAKLFPRVSYIDFDQMIETVVMNCEKYDIIKLLKSDLPLCSNNMRTKETFFSMAITRYLDLRKDERIRLKLSEIILSNNDLLDKLKTATVFSTSTYRRVLNEMLDLSHTSPVDLILNHPNLMKSLPDIFTPYHVKQAMTKKYDIIYETPCRFLLRDTILHEIRLNGYFPMILINDNDMIMSYLGATDLTALLSLGHGFGYILDHTLCDVVYALLATAIRYIEETPR